MVKTKEIFVSYLLFMVFIIAISESEAQEVYVKPCSLSYFLAYIHAFITTAEKVDFNLRSIYAYVILIKDFFSYNKKFLLNTTSELIDLALFISKNFKNDTLVVKEV
ncbi:MAG: hypothetical protein ABWJ98_00690 [Hydrogenothermaceae bacterium]